MCKSTGERRTANYKNQKNTSGFLDEHSIVGAVLTCLGRTVYRSVRLQKGTSCQEPPAVTHLGPQSACRCIDSVIFYGAVHSKPQKQTN